MRTPVYEFNLAERPVGGSTKEYAVPLLLKRRIRFRRREPKISSQVVRKIRIPNRPNCFRRTSSGGWRKYLTGRYILDGEHLMSIELSLPEARRLAIVSQGFGDRASKPSIARLRALAARLHAFQIDSVNVLVRAHYVPAFARLGPYPMDALDTLAYRTRELFEYWGHAACLLPNALYPLVRYRMEKHTAVTQEYMRSERGAELAKVYAEVAERGPITAAELTALVSVQVSGGAGAMERPGSNICTMQASWQSLDAVASSGCTTSRNV